MAGKILRGYKALTDKIGGSRVKAWRDVRDGVLPAPIILGPNSVGWFEDEIDEWLANRPRANYAPEQPIEDEDVPAVALTALADAAPPKICASVDKKLVHHDQVATS